MLRIAGSVHVEDVEIVGLANSLRSLRCWEILRAPIVYLIPVITGLDSQGYSRFDHLPMPKLPCSRLSSPGTEKAWRVNRDA